ncbi:MAG: transcriptional regulator [Candidatus Odinarchaeota archaeon]
MENQTTSRENSAKNSLKDTKKPAKLAKYPSELEVWFVLPTLHRELAMNLKKTGLRQNTIAELLELSPAAVSYYLRKERAKDIDFPDNINREIAVAAQRIYEDPSRYFEEVHALLKMVRETGVLCQIHAEKGKIRENCSVCMQSMASHG